MKIKVYGKAHIQGTSKKTGNAYNLTVIHTLMPARGVDGVAARTIMLDATKFPVTGVQLNGEYNAEFDNTGYCVDFEGIKA